MNKLQLYYLIALIDKKLNRCVNLILHHPCLQKLEASWRGLHYLTGFVSPTDKVKIKILNISWPEISKDLSHSIEFDQSLLFAKIYTEEFGLAGGEPFGLLIGDYSISHQMKNAVANLRSLTSIAAAAFSPIILATDSTLFGLDDFNGFDRWFNLDRMFQQQEYIAWNQLREGEDSRFFGLVLPRVLMRLPYKQLKSRRKKFYFQETIFSKSDYLWGNAVYCFAAVAIRSFIENHWLADIRGVKKDSYSGGLVTDLPGYHFLIDNQTHYSVEIGLSEKQERVLTDWGFISLCHCQYSGLAAFYSSQSIQAVKQYDNEAANNNAQLSAMLPYVLCASRFAHYIKVIMRDKIGSFISVSDCENYLQNWLRQYLADSNDLSIELSAKYPLKTASVSLSEQVGKPGYYLCVLKLSPQYQLEQIQTQLEMKTELLASELKL